MQDGLVSGSGLRLRVKELGLYTAIHLEPRHTANKGSDAPSLSHKNNLNGEITSGPDKLI